MTYKFQYITQGERENLITENSLKYLIEEQNITEGNFLIFADSVPETKVVEVQQPITNADLVAVQTQNLDIMQGIADLWTAVNAMKGTV